MNIIFEIEYKGYEISVVDNEEMDYDEWRGEYVICEINEEAA